MMSFIIGVIVGAYIDQNFDIPNIKCIGNDLLKHIKSLEKDESKKKK